MQLSTITRRLLAAATMPCLVACTAERRAGSPSQASGSQGSRESPAQGEAFAAGTVGAALDEYRIDMNGVRRWYDVVRVVARHATEDSTYHLRLNMQLDAPLQPYLAQVEGDSVLRSLLAQQKMSARDFALLAGAISGARIAQQMVDSLGPSGRPTNLGPQILTFFRMHWREIDSLDATIR